MRYDYISPNGEVIELQYRMGKQPAAVVFVDGVAHPAKEDAEGAWVQKIGVPQVAVVGNGAAPLGPSGLPVSRTLPILRGGKPETVNGRTLFRHSSGALTDNVGRQIISSKADRDRVKREGYTPA